MPSSLCRASPPHRWPQEAPKSCKSLTQNGPGTHAPGLPLQYTPLHGCEEPLPHGFPVSQCLLPLPHCAPLVASYSAASMCIASGGDRGGAGGEGDAEGGGRAGGGLIGAGGT